MTSTWNTCDWSEAKKLYDGMSNLRKIRAIKPCLDPAHNPPSHLYLEAGEYEWTCPSCGKKVEFVVPSITFASHAYNGVMPKQTLTA